MSAAKKRRAKRVPDEVKRSNREEALRSAMSALKSQIADLREALSISDYQRARAEEKLREAAETIKTLTRPQMSMQSFVEQTLIARKSRDAALAAVANVTRERDELLAKLAEVTK